MLIDMNRHFTWSNEKSHSRTLDIVLNLLTAKNGEMPPDKSWKVITPMPQTSEAGEASEQFITSGDMYSIVLKEKMFKQLLKNSG